MNARPHSTLHGREMYGYFALHSTLLHSLSNPAGMEALPKNFPQHACKNGPRLYTASCSYDTRIRAAVPELLTACSPCRVGRFTMWVTGVSEHSRCTSNTSDVVCLGQHCSQRHHRSSTHRNRAARQRKTRVVPTGTKLSLQFLLCVEDGSEPQSKGCFFLKTAAALALMNVVQTSTRSSQSPTRSPTRCRFHHDTRLLSFGVR